MKNTSKNIFNVIAGLNLKYFMECNAISVQDVAKSLGVKVDAVNKMLDGTNGISGRYNRILIEKYNCDLNFIYGGIPYYDVIKDNCRFEKQLSDGKKIEAISREMRYLVNVVEYINEL